MEEVRVSVEELEDFGFGLEQDLSEPIRSCDVLNGSGIYAIVNKINGKCYIGSAKCLKIRWRNHKSELVKGKHHCIHLQNSFNKHGVENFKFTILDIVPFPEHLAECEQAYFDLCKPEYNVYPTARSPLGSKHSEETKEKIRVANKGRKRSEESCRNNGLAKKGMKHTDEAKLKMSKAAKGRIFTEEHKRKIGEATKKQVKTGIGQRRSGAGVYLNSSGKSWKAMIRVNFKNVILGNYPTKELALEARLAAEQIYWNDNPFVQQDIYDLKNVNEKFTKNVNNRKSGSGVTKTKADTYKVTFYLNGKRINLGTFSTYDEALNIRLEAENKYWNNHNIDEIT